jgi:hypothetical protein
MDMAKGEWVPSVMTAARLAILLAAWALLPRCSVEESGGGEGGAEDGGSSSDAGQPPETGGSGSCCSSGGAGAPPASGGSAGIGGLSGSPGGAGEGGSPTSSNGGAGAAGETSVPEDGGAAGAGGSPAVGPLCGVLGQYCNIGLDCPWYHACVNQHCVPVAEGEPCGNGGFCGESQFCNAQNGCQNKRILEFESCEDESEATCPPGFGCYWLSPPHGAFEYRCIDTSTNTGFCDLGSIACADGYYCPTYIGDLTDPYCNAQGDLNAFCVAEEPTSCRKGLSCNFNKCTPEEAPIGAACEPYIGSDLGGLREYDARFPLACQRGAFCQDTGEFDSLQRSIGVCSANLPNGAPCFFDFECRGYCDGGTCAPNPLGPSCGADGSCPAGLICDYEPRTSLGTCRPELSVGADCATGSGFCTTGSLCLSDRVNGPRTCRKIASEGQSCEEAVCTLGTICVREPSASP